MFRFVGLCFGILVRLFRERRSLLLENLVLRQQLVALKRRHPRPSLGPSDKLFWVIARRVWSAWKQSLIIVTPETVVRWHRGGFPFVLEADLQGQEAGRKKTTYNRRPTAHIYCLHRTKCFRKTLAAGLFRLFLWRGFPELDAVAIGIHDPAEFSVVVFLDFRIHPHTFLLHGTEHGVQIVDYIVHHEGCL